MTTDTRGFSITPRLIAGLLIVAFGLVLTLDNLDVLDGGNLIRYWPFGLIAVGVAKLLQDRDRSGRIGGAILVLIGAMIAADRFYFFEIHVWRFWPLAIVFFGAVILWKALRPVSDVGRQEAGPVVGGGAVPFGTVGLSAPKPGTMEHTLSEFAVWSGIVRRVSSPAFRRADLTAVMGGIELDLRQAGTEGGDAVIDVFVLWGGIEITVPPDWAVSNQITPIMGGADDRSTGTQQSRHRLIVKGLVIMGGVDIKI
jgi:uncharacterized membrane protein YeaQ/YmgE (transglycosylase-associated protein family)